MKLTTLSTGILVLSFTLAIANASDLQLAAASPAEKFDDECGQCHGTAEEFVGESLAFKDNQLTGLGSEMAVSEFLKDHRKLKPEEARFYTEMLTRVAGEIGLK